MRNRRKERRKVPYGDEVAKRQDSYSEHVTISTLEVVVGVHHEFVYKKKWLDDGVAWDIAKIYVHK